MFNPIDLFKQRFTEHMKLLNRYLRYIFNGHFMIALIFIIVTLSVYYQKWLETISPNFPSVFVIAIVLGIIVSYNPIQSFLKEPDKVFLIVKEMEMHRYFRLTVMYNYIFQLYSVFLAIAAIGPLYAHTFPAKSKKDYLLLLIIILVVKGWNLLTNWYMLKVHHPLIRIFDQWLRTIVSIALFYFILHGEFVVIIVGVFFAIVLNDYILSRRQSGLAWDILIANDQHRLGQFYRFVSMFADVPQLAKKLRKRRLFASLINHYIPFQNAATYRYLFRLTFIRSSDYLSMYVRLIVIGGAIIIFVPNGWLKIVLALLFIYMASFQMISLYFHHGTNIWLDLYPVDKAEKKEAFIKFSSQLTMVQTILYVILFLILLDYTSALSMFALGILFNYLFQHYYVMQKLKKV